MMAPLGEQGAEEDKGGFAGGDNFFSSVMPGLVPGIHVFAIQTADNRRRAQ